MFPVDEIRRAMSEFDDGTKKKSQKKKRKTQQRKVKDPIVFPAPVKAPKIKPGQLYTVGKNDSCQLGLPQGVPLCTKPQLVSTLKDKMIKMVACGANHTLVLDTEGTVWSFGSNKNGALGQPGASMNEDYMTPAPVNLPAKVKQISAGNAHSAALTVDGEVYAWGCYKNKAGTERMGIDSYLESADDPEYCDRPWDLTSLLNEEAEVDDVRVIKIVSGANHIIMLGDDSRMYTCGAWEHGQLGREHSDPKRLTRGLAATTGGAPVVLTNREYYLKPRMVYVGNKYDVKNVWAGKNATFCLAGKVGFIYVCGDNTYSQLGIQLVKNKFLDTYTIKHPNRANAFNQGEFQTVRWRQIAGGLDHTVAVTETGEVFSIGKHYMGRLGLFPLPGLQGEHVGPVPKKVSNLENKICVQVAAGNESGYALTLDGILYAWGVSDGLHGESKVFNQGPKPCVGIDRSLDIMRISVGGGHIALSLMKKSDNQNVGGVGN